VPGPAEAVDQRLRLLRQRETRSPDRLPEVLKVTKKLCASYSSPLLACISHAPVYVERERHSARF